MSLPNAHDAVHALARMPPTCGGYRVARRAEVLNAISGADVSLAVYRRTLPEEASSVLARWAGSCDPSFDEIVEVASWDPAAATTGLNDASVRRWLHADVSLLIAAIASLAESARIRVKLRAVRTDACRKFHLDYIRMRLITTYAGPGTEWLPHHAARRDILEHPPESARDANRAIVRDGRSVRRARTGDVLLMKGKRHRGGLGVVHRSPPIETFGGTRLVLTLTSADDD